MDQLGVIGTGVYVLGAIDRRLAGLAALEGDDDVADELSAAALELRMTALVAQVDALVEPR